MIIRLEAFSGTKNARGFTLIELLVALVIFAVGIAGVVKLHVASIAGNTYSMQFTNAMNVAQSEAERLKDITFNVNQVTDGVNDGVTDDLEVGVPHASARIWLFNNINYVPTWTVQPAVGVDSRLLHVTMTVTWNDKGAQRTHRMNFYTGTN